MIINKNHFLKFIAILATASLSIYSSLLLAANGFNLIGFGAKSMGLAGADVASSDDTASLNINPAGLSAIKNSELELYAGGVFSMDTGHKDQFGNNADSKLDKIFGGTVSFARHLENTPFTVGIGIFAQGGSGTKYSNLNTAFGTQDKLGTVIRIARFNMGFSYLLNPSTSLGLSLLTTFADSEQDIFPNTSYFSGDPNTSFFGYELKNMKGSSPTFKLGLQYRLRPELTVGLAFTRKNELVLKNGKLISDQNSIGNGYVTYKNAKLTGFYIPTEINTGLLWHIDKKWNLHAEITWLDWSKAYHSTTLSVSEPNNPGAPPSFSQTLLVDWRDQYVMAIAAEYHLSPVNTIRCGYNYGRNPIPAKRLTPTINAFAQHHLTLGSSHKILEGWTIHTAAEYILKQSVTYTNPDLPFGTNAEEHGESISFHITATNQW